MAVAGYASGVATGSTWRWGSVAIWTRSASWIPRCTAARVVWKACRNSCSAAHALLKATRLSEDQRTNHAHGETGAIDPKATSRVRGRVLAPFGGALPEASAFFARSGSPVINVNSGFV